MSQPAKDSSTAEIVPDKLWLSHIIVILKQSEKQTGMSFTMFLEMLEEQDEKFDHYDDRSICRAVLKYMKKLYPDEQEPRKQITPDTIN